MEISSNISGTRRPKEVHLNLCTSINGRKGCALVGRLETDKNLNRGIVISMIKKGWGIDKGMEIHEMPDKNAFLFRFTRQEDYHRVLKGRPWSIQNAMLNLQPWDDYMNYCYDCGRIGHEARNCKFQPETTEDAMADARVGNGLGTQHVKTIEEALVAHDMDWDESKFLIKKPTPTTG
ncbi:hypothetical protein K1719_003350 [Acacia pycnantha]|nr:hypothetical protein K1719_003350 [Acacia pycnantha]